MDIMYPTICLKYEEIRFHNLFNLDSTTLLVIACMRNTIDYCAISRG